VLSCAEKQLSIRNSLASQQIMPDTANLPGPQAASTFSGWQAKLALGYEFAQGRTALAQRRHRGPLVVQKALYPEGDAVCHTIVVHPPGGIAGGDRLDIGIDAASGAQVLVTTPGAAKWYKANGRESQQNVRLAIASGAVVEWLPQETIVFDGACARLRMVAELEPGARYLGWEILVLGRRASGENFTSGSLRQDTVLRCAGRDMLVESSRLAGGDPLLVSPAGLAGCHVVGSLIAAGAVCPDAVLENCRGIAPDGGARHALTRLPGALVARYLGSSPQDARAYFTALWQQLRPWLAGREAGVPRIWKT
jgi:urease accessory protein